MHSLPKCIKTGKKRPEFFSKYKGALYSLPPFKLLFLHIFVYSQFCLLENSSFHVLGQTKSPLPVNANAIGRINSPIPVTSCIKSVSSYTSILQSTKKDIFLSFFDNFLLQNKKEQVDLPALFAVNYIFSSLYAFLPSISVQVYSPFFSDFSNLPE